MSTKIALRALDRELAAELAARRSDRCTSIARKAEAMNQEHSWQYFGVDSEANKLVVRCRRWRCAARALIDLFESPPKNADCAGVNWSSDIPKDMTVGPLERVRAALARADECGGPMVCATVGLSRDDLKAILEVMNVAVEWRHDQPIDFDDWSATEALNRAIDELENKR